MEHFSKVRFVLVNTTHPGNIGATARAMKNMGFSNLYLVAPRLFPDPEAITRSSGADDILTQATVVASFKEAIADCALVFGTSARERALPLPLLTPKSGANKIKKTVAKQQSVAVVFGQERTGLTNEQLSSCHYHLYIPCDEAFASLNLAAAVQVIAYELRLALLEQAPKTNAPLTLASVAETENFYKHLEQVLILIGFLDPENPRLLMRKLKRLFNRASLEPNEINILRGILTLVEKLQQDEGDSSGVNPIIC